MRLAGVAMLGVGISVAGALVGQHAAQHLPFAVPADQAPAKTAATSAATPLQAQAKPAAARRVYPYSIVPGGVLDRAELAAVIKRDKVAAAHYADFQVDKAVPVKVAKARAVYVSYRKDGQVYWTSKKVMLAEGEILLSDGTSEIRTRCGNRISETRRLPVAAKEPAPEVLDTAMEADEGGAEPTAMGMPDDGLGVFGSAHSAVTFANGSGLIQVNNGDTWTGTALPGMSDTPRAYTGRPVTVTAPKASQVNPGIGPGARGTVVNGRGNGDSGTRTLTTGVSPAPEEPANPVAGGPDLGPVGAPPFSNTPELPPLPESLGPVPSTPLAPAQPTPGTASVPEPGSLWLSGIALAGLAFLRRKTRQAR